MTLRFDTIAVQAGLAIDLDHAGNNDCGAVVAPIVHSTTFAQRELGGTPPYCYSRSGNPTRSALERALAALEGATHGLAFASGLAAAQAVLLTLRTGDRVVASQDLYGGCHRLFTKVFARFGIAFDLIDTTDPGEVDRALGSGAPPRLLWIETPSNPLLRVTDVEGCSEIARRRGVRTLVDNTFATPLLQRPLELGADLVLHSTTKYVGGHCDVIGGALVTSDDALAAELGFLQNAAGAVPSPHDCSLLLRGLRTIGVRVRKQIESAAWLAERLDALPGIARVIYPGRNDHPQHALARRQSPGFGAVMSIELEGGRESAAALVRRTRLWTLAESLGGHRSLLCHPATMTHAALSDSERDRVGISQGLLRLSVGLEDPRDLLEDLEQATSASNAAVTARDPAADGRDRAPVSSTAGDVLP